MRKKYLTSLLLTGLVLVSLTGCQNEKETASQGEQQTQKEQQTSGDVQQTTAEEQQAQEGQQATAEEQQAQEEQPTSGDADIAKASYIDTCSLCETEQICGTYTAEGQEYVVCHDCSNEFTTAFAETADKHTCSLCEVEKICATYIVDNKEYIVCPDDFEEFAHGMKLIEE